MGYFLDPSLNEEPCMNCTHFEVGMHEEGMFGNTDLLFVEHEIYCQNQDLCKKLKEHIRKELENENKKSIQKESPDE